MKKTLHPIPVADLSDEVWTIDHISAYMRMRPSAAYARIRQAGFPEPFTGNCRHRRWLAVEVKAHFAGAQPRTAPAPAPVRAAAPFHAGTPTVRPRRQKKVTA